MKANNTLQNLSNGYNRKAQITTPFGHTLATMGGIIDMTVKGGRTVTLESMLINLNQVFGVITEGCKLPQNQNDDCMTIMKVVPHLQWLTRKGGLARCQSVFGITQGNYRHGLVTHFATAILAEIAETVDLKAMAERVRLLKLTTKIEFAEL